MTEVDSWPVFICYRQSDGKDSARWVHDLLRERPVPVVEHDAGDHDPPKLDVYFDQTAPGVGDWTAIHEPYLKLSRAFIIICTPGAKLNEGENDWVHLEIDWWLDNRQEAPIIVDPLNEGDRYIPTAIKERWPNVQRITLDVADWNNLPADEQSTIEDRKSAQFFGGIVPSGTNVLRQELDAKQRTAERLAGALRRSRLLLAGTVGLFVLAVAAGVWAWNERLEAEQQAAIATNARNVSERAKDRALHAAKVSRQALYTSFVDAHATSRLNLEKLPRDAATQNEFAITGNNLGFLLIDRLSGENRNAEHALQLFEQLRDKYPHFQAGSNFSGDLLLEEKITDVGLALAQGLQKLGDLEAGAQALATLTPSERRRTRWKENVFRAFLELSNHRFTQGNYQGAFEDAKLILKALDRFPADNAIGYRLRARAFGKLSWNALFVRDFERSATAASKAIELIEAHGMGGLEFVYLNRAHAFAFANNAKEAGKLYGAVDGQMLANDIQALAKAGLCHELFRAYLKDYSCAN
ncbi:MAG: hypothetical protein AAGF81_00190 [Pseudomonadota bacterium]